MLLYFKSSEVNVECCYFETRSHTGLENHNNINWVNYPFKMLCRSYTDCVVSHKHMTSAHITLWLWSSTAIHVTNDCQIDSAICLPTNKPDRIVGEARDVWNSFGSGGYLTLMNELQHKSSLSPAWQTLGETLKEDFFRNNSSVMWVCDTVHWCCRSVMTGSRHTKTLWCLLEMSWYQ